MIKASVLFLNFIGLLFFGLFNDAEVLVENNTPATISPGTKKEVQLVVTKGQVQGFSKLELTLPYGFVATPGDIKGASFTFSGQKAKFLWMTLPTEENFTVTYFIESTENMEGDYDITGTFSYVKENKREDISIPSKTVNVKKVIGLTPEEVAQTMPGVKVEESVVDMVCERIIEKVSVTEFKITLSVSNNTIRGLFGKILETVPSNCATEVTNDAGATVTQQGNTIKFVWFQTPDAGSFECSYKIECDEATHWPTINGVFSYVVDGNPVDLPVILAGEAPSEAIVRNEVNTITTIPVNENTDTSANNTATQNNNASSMENNNTTTAQNNTNSSSTNNTTNNTSASNNASESAVTSVPSAETGITYRVQILAAHRVVNKTFMKKTYNFTQAYTIENIDGWVKYTTGKFLEYSAARDAREELKTKHNNLPGPFVTAYNDGERLTVQEALLISQQQWYK